MTIEAVVTKSMWLLAQNCESFDQLQQRFYRQVNFDTFYSAEHQLFFRTPAAPAVHSKTYPRLH